MLKGVRGRRRAQRTHTEPGDRGIDAGFAAVMPHDVLVDGAGIQRATAQLPDPAVAEPRHTALSVTRTRLQKCRMPMQRARYFPSHTAFLFHEVRGDQMEYIRRMREHGILVGRPFPPLLSFNRLSLSATPEQLERFTDTLRTFRQNGWA